MVSGRLKKRFEALVASRVGPLASVGITPNTVTALGLLVSIAAAWAFVGWGGNRLMLPAAGALVLLSGLLDAVDGVLARAGGEESKLGGFLDSVSDRYSDAMVLSGVLVSGLCSPVFGLAAIVGSLMVSYARARAEAAGVGMVAVGLAERAERMLLLAAASFAAYFWVEAMNWGVALLAVLAHFTVLQRALHFYREAG